MKKKFVLRIDEYVYEALERWAADEFRSVNGQIESILYERLKDAKRLKKKIAIEPQAETEEQE
ncbi:MAG: Arc family DNA binding domain-containing protein [Saprospiraceae bacterium]